MESARFRHVLFAIVALSIGATPAAAGDPGREFTATAKMTTRQGSRSMPVTLVAHRYTPLDQAQFLKDILSSGGQGALIANLRTRSDGRLRLGVLEIPISMAIAEPVGNGYRYVFVTDRRIKVEEVNEGADSLEYPFGVAIFEVGDFGSGRGEIYPAAALEIEDDGSVKIEQYESDPGTLTAVKKVR